MPYAECLAQKSLTQNDCRIAVSASQSAVAGASARRFELLRDSVFHPRQPYYSLALVDIIPANAGAGRVSITRSCDGDHKQSIKCSCVELMRGIAVGNAAAQRFHCGDDRLGRPVERSETSHLAAAKSACLAESLYPRRMYTLQVPAGTKLRSRPYHPQFRRPANAEPHHRHHHARPRVPARAQ